MDLETLIVAVFCLVDDFVRDLCRERRLRQRGPAPVLADSEVLTVEIVGEFLVRLADPCTTVARRGRDRRRDGRPDRRRAGRGSAPPRVPAPRPARVPPSTSAPSAPPATAGRSTPPP